MTEDEAKTKWCFHFIASHTDPRQRLWRPEDHQQGAVSGEPTGDFSHACIGSACMAWRLIPFDTTAAKIVAIKEYRSVHGGDLLTAKNAVEANWHPDGAHGYCGLAGRP